MNTGTFIGIQEEDQGEQSGGVRQQLSSLSLLFSHLSALDSVPHASRKPKPFTNQTSFTTSNPQAVLAELMGALKANDIPGPRLLRLKTEFSSRIGYGAQFEVFGVSPSLVEKLERYSGHPEVDDLCNAFQAIAIKRCRPLEGTGSQKFTTANRTESPTKVTPPTTVTSVNFGFQLRVIQREIDALCYAPFRNQKHIVKMVGWGLCLDTLSKESETAPILPLLVLERADCNLTEFVRSTFPERQASYEALCKICFGVGLGLQVLHEENIAHGDLKPENILMFKDGVGGWLAKLCDFGLSSEDSDSSDESVTYHGTPGWRPPEVIGQGNGALKSGSLQLCDIFAFGLVIWSVFGRRGKAPLNSLEESQGTACQLARRDIGSKGMDGHFHFDPATKSFILQSGSTNIEGTKVGSTFRPNELFHIFDGALQSNPRKRKRRPWQIFDSTAEAFPWRTTSQSPAWKCFLPSWVLEGLDHPKRGTPRGIAMQHPSSSSSTSNRTLVSDENHFHQDSSLPMLKSRQILGKEQSHPNEDAKLPAGPFYALRDIQTIQEQPYQRRDFANTIQRYGSLRHSPHNFGLSTTSHAGECMTGLEKFYNHLLDAARNGKEIYGLARLRTEIPLCCWLKLDGGRPRNMLRKAMKNPRMYEMSSLSWLCKGEIGLYELQNPKETRWKLWNAVLSVPSPLYYNLSLAEERSAWSSNALERCRWLLLLVENGGHLEDRLYVDGEPIFTESLKAMRIKLRFEENPTGINPDQLILELCRTFRNLSKGQSVSSFTRFYLTGTLPDVFENLDDFPSTALHDAIRVGDYAAVEGLIRSEFSTTCLDHAQLTPLHLAHELASKPARSDAAGTRVNRYRILGLLQQSGAPYSVGLVGFKLDAAANIPLGWVETEFRVPMTNPTDFLRLYTEFYTQSVTTEPPTFSLFEDRKLALGYRKLVAQGMTYYTDLLQFIGAQNQPWPLSSYGLQKTPNGKLPKGTEYLERENRIVHDLVEFFGSEEAIAQLRIDDQLRGLLERKKWFLWNWEEDENERFKSRRRSGLRILYYRARQWRRKLVGLYWNKDRVGWGKQLLLIKRTVNMGILQSASSLLKNPVISSRLLSKSLDKEAAPTPRASQEEEYFAVLRTTEFSQGQSTEEDPDESDDGETYIYLPF